MKVPKGNGMVQVPMTTEADFIAATKNPLFANGTVYAVESAADWNTLLRVLQSTVRPFAVCVVVPR
jgi:hypothetical protein